ncbi:putative vesicular amine transporter [Ixodes scapularis]
MAEAQCESAVRGWPKNWCSWMVGHSWIIFLVFTHFCTTLGGALLQPYYPSLAASKGLEAWKYGFVFSAQKIARTAAAIMADRVIMWTSLRKTLLISQTGLNASVVFFGFVYWSQSGEILLGTSLVVATFGGFMDGIYAVSLYTAGAAACSENTGMIISTIDLMWGIGHMLGSVSGGALVKLWAYPLPFFVLGSIGLVVIPLIATRKKIPGEENKTKCEGPMLEESQSQHASYYRLLLNPAFAIDIGSMMLSWVIMAFNEPTLQPYLATQFKMDSTQVGVVFMVQYASYTIGSLSSAILCSLKMETFFGFFGHVLTIIAYLILGPAPFISCEPTLWMVYLAQVFIGVGTAAQFACHYSHALKVAGKRGYPDTIRTISFVSSVVFSSLMTVAIATSPVAGYLAETFGYRNGSMALLGVILIWLPATFLQWIQSLCAEKRRRRLYVLERPTSSSRELGYI